MPEAGTLGPEAPAGGKALRVAAGSEEFRVRPGPFDEVVADGTCREAVMLGRHQRRAAFAVGQMGRGPPGPPGDARR